MPHSGARAHKKIVGLNIGACGLGTSFDEAYAATKSKEPGQKTCGVHDIDQYQTERGTKSILLTSDRTDDNFESNMWGELLHSPFPRTYNDFKNSLAMFGGISYYGIHNKIAPKRQLGIQESFRAAKRRSVLRPNAQYNPTSWRFSSRRRRYQPFRRYSRRYRYRSKYFRRR